MSATQITTPIASKERRRKALLLALTGSVGLAAAGAGAYWYLVGSHFITTDNAYTAVEIAQVTPSVGGTISAVLVTDTQSVKKDDILVQIDQTDARLALAQAEADAQRAAAQLAAAESEVERAAIDLKRRNALISSGSVSGDEVTHAQNAMNTARANLDGAKAAVAQTRARAEQARVDLDRTVVRAPVDGVVAKRQVQLGQRVQAGFPLLGVVPVQEMHVDANFKEVQLKKVRIGQPVILHADIYGSAVTYHGTVEGFSASSRGSSLMRTGRRCTTLIQLPVAFWAGMAEKAEPEPPEKPSTVPW